MSTHLHLDCCEKQEKDGKCDGYMHSDSERLSSPPQRKTSPSAPAKPGHLTVEHQSKDRTHSAGETSKVSIVFQTQKHISHNCPLSLSFHD